MEFLLHCEGVTNFDEHLKPKDMKHNYSCKKGEEEWSPCVEKFDGNAICAIGYGVTL
jgi:hypothetical protein